jgi:hypothetical protein
LLRPRQIYAWQAKRLAWKEVQQKKLAAADEEKVAATGNPLPPNADGSDRGGRAPAMGSGAAQDTRVWADAELRRQNGTAQRRKVLRRTSVPHLTALLYSSFGLGHFDLRRRPQSHATWNRWPCGS